MSFLVKHEGSWPDYAHLQASQNQFNNYYLIVFGKFIMPPLRRYISTDGTALEYMPHILSQLVRQIELYPTHLSTSSLAQDNIDWTYHFINAGGLTIEKQMEVPSVSDIQLPRERDLSRSEWGMLLCI